MLEVNGVGATSAANSQSASPTQSSMKLTVGEKKELSLPNLPTNSGVFAEAQIAQPKGMLDKFMSAFKPPTVSVTVTARETPESSGSGGPQENAATSGAGTPQPAISAGGPPDIPPRPPSDGNGGGGDGGDGDRGGNGGRGDGIGHSPGDALKMMQDRMDQQMVENIFNQMEMNDKQHEMKMAMSEMQQQRFERNQLDKVAVDMTADSMKNADNARQKLGDAAGA
jgi:hypothetical protein